MENHLTNDDITNEEADLEHDYEHGDVEDDELEAAAGLYHEN